MPRSPVKSLTSTAASPPDTSLNPPVRPDDGIRIDSKKFGTSLRRLAPGNSVGAKELARLTSGIKHG